MLISYNNYHKNEIFWYDIEFLKLTNELINAASVK